MEMEVDKSVIDIIIDGDGSANADADVAFRVIMTNLKVKSCQL